LPHNALIERIASAKQFKKTAKIFRKGEAARHLYRAVEGCVQTYFGSGSDLVVMGFYYPGDYFGFELRGKFTYSARALAPTRCLAIAKGKLARLAAAEPSVARWLLHTTNDELDRALQHSLLLRQSAEERVANFLFAMKKRNQNREIKLLMTRTDMAQYLSLTSESVSRALARLQKLRAISFSTQRTVVVHLRKPLIV